MKKFEPQGPKGPDLVLERLPRSVVCLHPSLPDPRFLRVCLLSSRIGTSKGSEITVFDLTILEDVVVSPGDFILNLCDY
jgi:hypothetical protein